MADLIHRVADLIDGRDREDLEVTLARVTFDLAEARTLAFWRVYHRDDGVWLRKRVSLPNDGNEWSDDDVPLAAAREPLRLAYQSKSVARWRELDVSGCVLPAPGGSDILGLIEIETAAALDRDRLATLLGMLRIYRSHLAALDYADTDELTRLANRRTFDEQFARHALAEARRKQDAPEARAHLGVADIDFFKQVNDRYGHPYGDEVLVLFAGLMRATFRDNDKLFRFGGEEFVILMSNCNVEDALAAFERFRAVVGAYNFPQVGKITVSVGVTSIRPIEAGLAAFGRADQALYVAKRRGRNRVLLFEALEEGLLLEALRRPAREAELF